MEQQAKKVQSILVFRLGHQLFGLPTLSIQEVSPIKKIHRIPHRSGKILSGLVNLNGELRLSVSLYALLSVESFPGKDIGRMIAIKREGDCWVFPVDSVEGILSCREEEIKKASDPYIKGYMEIENLSFALLDEELIFQSLQKDPA